MKRIFISVAAATIVAAAFSACTSTKKASSHGGRASGGKITSIEQLSIVPGAKVDAPRFLGGVYSKNLVADGAAGAFPVTNLIVFEPKARSAWHTHGGMILLITDGVGYYQEEGKPAQILRKGDIFEIPEGVRHWHGASKDSWFSQIVIYDSHWNGAHGDGKIEFVSDEEYEQLAEEEYAGRVEPKFGSQMFSRAEKGAKLPTFTGTAFVNDLTGAENAAKCPPLHYVVFEPGVINNWHIHEGGQILLATDGIGYHQMEGGEVQILRPGDVALCPPGVKHWHGGSKETVFAHITASTNPDTPGVIWLEPLSQEEYDALPAAE